ncbi:MAG: hypothetical protein WC306_00800 [Candidatus Paceibacterota bacterium]|jgi:hypothetical protein
MNTLSRDFVSDEQRQYKFKIGKTLASSLSGFIAGIIFASIFWIVMFYFIQ